MSKRSINLTVTLSVKESISVAMVIDNDVVLLHGT